VAILVTDNFNRADSGTIGNDSNGNAWVERAGAWEIFTSSVRQTDAVTVPGCLLCGTDTGSVDHWAEAKLAVSDGSDQIGIVVRLDPTTFTGISMEVADGAYKVIRVTNGTPDTGATGDSHTHAAGEVYACEIIDSTDTINFYLNGALVFTTTGEAHNAGDTRVGLHINADVGNNAVRWDNFRAGNGTYPGPVPPTLPTFMTAGTGVLTATSSAACTPGIPSGVIAGELLIAHVFYGGSTTTPDTPSGWTLLRGPDSLTTPSTNGRSWVFGKKAVGSDAAPAFGTQAVTTPRRARVYRFTNARDDTVANMVGGFNFETGSVATFPDVGVTTPEDNCLAINLVAQAENLPAAASFTGETGGDWVQAIAAFTGTTGTPDTLLQLQTAVMETTGTVNGGTFASGIAVPRGITGFYIRGPASSGTNLIVADAQQSQSVDNVALTQIHVLVIQDTGQAQTVDSPVLTQVHQLVVQDTAQTQFVDNVVLEVSSATNLVVQDATQGQSVDSVVLTQAHQLSVADASQAQAADGLALTQAHNLAAFDAVQAQAADSVALTQVHALTVQEATQGHTADSVVLTVGGIDLIVADVLHAHAVDGVVLAQVHQLAIADGLQGQTTDSLALTQVHVLAVADALQFQLADNAVLFVGEPPVVPAVLTGGAIRRPSSLVATLAPLTLADLED